MKKSTLLVAFFISLLSFSQNCDCESNFKWMKTTFEENDAGFEYVIKQKGNELYKQHNKIFLTKVKKTTNKTKCFELMREWMKFFRKGHFGIRPLNQESTKTNRNIDNWETININLKKFKREIENKKNTDYEGIWKTGPYTIGIKKTENGYKGFIIEAEGSQWKKGQVKLEIKADNSCTYFMGDYSSKKIESVELLGNKYLQLDNFSTLKRIFPESENDPKIERYYKAISAEKPYIERLNHNTLLLRIPSFSSNLRTITNNLINNNKEEILKTKNLIIDLRDNGGGSDNNFKVLLPLLYTNPIETVGVELLSTRKNNQRVKDFITNPNWSEEGKEWARKAYDKLAKNEGEYINLEDSKVTTTKFDTIYPYPKNVGIIINGQNASTTEEFLLAAKQSKKVKLFGQTTFGALDISYTYPAKSPCGDFELIYCLSKSLRIPEMTIDNKGIHPDYFIYNEVPKYKWIDFVMHKLN